VVSFFEFEPGDGDVARLAAGDFFVAEEQDMVRGSLAGVRPASLMPPLFMWSFGSILAFVRARLLLGAMDERHFGSISRKSWK
jgi:hypothetical protein